MVPLDIQRLRRATSLGLPQTLQRLYFTRVPLLALDPCVP